MAYKNLRDYLAELARRDLLHVIEDEISKDTELVPLVRLQFRGLAEAQRKAFWFRNVTDARGRHFDARRRQSTAPPSASPRRRSAPNGRAPTAGR